MFSETLHETLTVFRNLSFSFPLRHFLITFIFQTACKKEFVSHPVTVRKFSYDVSKEILYNIPKTDMINLLFSIFITYFLLNLLTIKTRTSVSFEQTTTLVFCCNAWKVILVLVSLWLYSNEILNVSFSFLTSIGCRLDRTKSSAQK